MANRLEIYQNNTITIDCSVYGINDVSSYSCYITAKSKTSTTNVMQVAGIIKDASGTLEFNLSSTDTSIVAGNYIYDITLEKDSSIYTLVKDSFIILDGVKY